tara:strand:- start:60122 stop:60397 length:276 start_codon:yes stop_codon:yes gene_type:complete
MQEAGFVNFLRTILIILAIYYGFKIIMRFAFPLILKNFMGKVEKKFQQQQRQQQSDQQQTKVGETIIDKAPRPNKKSNDSVGEYVDYEDVE